MGFKTDRDLRRPPADPYEPTNAGRMEGQFEGTATLMVRSSAGWDYGDEIAIEIVPNACYELPFEDSRLLYWSGIEVTVNTEVLLKKAGDPRVRKPGPYYVVAALEPAAWGWSVCAPLRGEKKKSNAERDQEIRDWVKAGCKIEDLTWDPFLRDKGKYAARLNDPM